ncbi:MAG: potassium channel family protein [Planctomycetota bacterium]|jgi:hypothetical protein
MVFQREKQNVSASDLLQALLDCEDIQLSQCTITGTLDLNRIFEPEEKFQTRKVSLRLNGEIKILTLSQTIVFDKCVFEDNVVFAGPWSQPDSITVEFEKDVVFNSSHFKGQARFRNACFKGTAGFDGCFFSGVTTFKNAQFCEDAKMRTTEFAGYALFPNACFNAAARFTNSHFVKGVNFTQTRFIGQTDFSGVYSSSRAVPAHQSIHFGLRKYGVDEGFWRFVKQSSLEAGYYHLAGESFYKERCARLACKLNGDALQSGRTFAQRLKERIWSLRLLPEIVFGKMLFGYGERPVRVLVASGVVIVFCALVYTNAGALICRDGNTAESSFLQSLYFSTITFTTLGYGDLYPSAHGFYRQLAMAEAVAGGCLMALFIVCLAKRFSRG